MRGMHPLKSLILMTPLIVVLFAGSCSDDGVTSPPCCPETPTLTNIWPNEDQTSWSYDYKFRSWEWDGWRLYEAEEDVPSAPALDEVVALMFHQRIGANPVSTYGMYKLEFDGDTTTMSGVIAQNLKETLVTTGDGPSGHIAGPGVPLVDPLLVRLAIARPDLRDRMLELMGTKAESLRLRLESVTGSSRDAAVSMLGGLGQPVPEPLFIHGYAWRKTSEWIGTFGDIDTLLAWKFLDAELSPGHEFIHRLVPGLALDVYLHCRVLRRLSIRTPAGKFIGALECIYMVDYGVAELITPGGDAPGESISGYARMFEYGNVVYVPTVGPAYSYQRMLVDAGDPPGTGYGEIQVILKDTTAPED
jgi:hypothetical protein